MSVEKRQDSSSRHGRQPLLEALSASEAGKWRSEHQPVVFIAKLDSFDHSGWLTSLFSLRGRPVRPVAVPMAIILVTTVVCALGTQTKVFGKQWSFEQPGKLSGSYSGIFVGVSFLLVFRLNRAAVRYYEARSALGQVIAGCREIASEACSGMSHNLQLRDEVCRWVVAYPVATRNYLRASKGASSVEELGGILSPEELRQLGSAQRQPLFCIDRIRQAAMAATRCNCKDDPMIRSVWLKEIIQSCQIIAFGMGAMERINTSPLPFGYVAHLRTFLMLYLIGMPFVFSSSWGWAGSGAMLVVAFGLLGLEAVSVTVERPFGIDSNHLKLDSTCDVIADDVKQSLEAAAVLSDDVKQVMEATAHLGNDMGENSLVRALGDPVTL